MAENYSDSFGVATANIMHIYINDTLIGGLSEVNIDFRGESLVFNAIGTPLPISTNIGRARVEITARAGLINMDLFEKTMGRVSVNGIDDVLVAGNSTLDNYNSEDVFRDVRFTLKGVISLQDANQTKKEIIVDNVVFNRYRLSIREGEFVMQDIDGVGSYMYHKNQSPPSGGGI